uniref:Ig-like domain-containing protein n=1 Tax=Serinus canaria TaxID=9135 RepID=A0A8C9NJ31_SERCA
MSGTKDGCPGQKGVQGNSVLHAWVGSGIGVLWRHGPQGFGVMACGCQGWGAPRCPQCHGDPPLTNLEPLSKMGPSCPTDDLVLQVPARALLEGDTVTLRCRGRWNSPVTKVRFFKDENNLTRSLNATELSLSPLQLNHSGSYRCKGWVRSWPSGSAAVTVTVHGEHPHGWNSHLLTAPKPLPSPTTGSPLTLSCLSTPSPLQLQASLLHSPSCSTGTGRWWGARRGPCSCWCLPWGVSHSGNYSCQVCSEEGRAVQKSSTRLRVMVCSECGDGHGESPLPPRVPCLGTSIPISVPTVPVANATITPGPLSMPPSPPVPCHTRCMQVTL